MKSRSTRPNTFINTILFYSYLTTTRARPRRLPNLEHIVIFFRTGETSFKSGLSDGKTLKRRRPVCGFSNDLCQMAVTPFRRTSVVGPRNPNGNVHGLFCPAGSKTPGRLGSGGGFAVGRLMDTNNGQITKNVRNGRTDGKRCIFEPNKRLTRGGQPFRRFYSVICFRPSTLTTHCRPLRRPRRLSSFLDRLACTRRLKTKQSMAVKVHSGG